MLNQKPSIPNIKTVAPAFSFRFHPNKYSNPSNDAVIPKKKKITAHRISIRQQIKSLESLTAPEEKFPLFYSSCSIFFFLSCWDLPPPSVVRQPFFLVASKQALHSAEQEARLQTVREGEAGWVEEEEEEEERRRLGGSKEATAFALLLLGFHLVCFSSLPFYIPSICRIGSLVFLFCSGYWFIDLCLLVLERSDFFCGSWWCLCDLFLLGRNCLVLTGWWWFGLVGGTKEEQSVPSLRNVCVEFDHVMNFLPPGFLPFSS